MKFIKRNKNIIIALVIFFIGILLCVKIKNILVPNEGAAVYGNRLDGKIEISKNLKSDIASKIDSATSVDIRVSGRIINVTLTLPTDVSKDAAKEFAKKSLEARFIELASKDEDIFILENIFVTFSNSSLLL